MVKSAYIHIPFCKNICSYCDFCKIYYNEKLVDNYLYSLEKEIKDKYENEKLDTIYIGGGTPSALSIKGLEKLFDITKSFKLEDDYEFTIECNIEDITIDMLELFKNNKVNRLSVGVQSFNNKILKYLGRNYDSKIIKEKIMLCKKYFYNINIDLIYAVNNQSLSDLEEDLNNILDLNISHVSCYSLIIEEHTKLYVNEVKPIDSDLDYEMYKLINKKLSKKYNHYEVSNYSIPGYESKHNLKYWMNEEYYGFGLSAAGYICNVRYTNTRNLNKYLNNEYGLDKEIIDKKSKIKYELILGFRLTKGINKDDFYKKYGILIYDIDNINKLISQGYLIDDTQNIYVNEKYFYVLNDILINFV
ncbi:MAG: radical SAM family heme chaperone HemW [Bacilli bacterium]|nr:radical SAM family heme chaperone HemW [Bacilli bacterium]